MYKKILVALENGPADQSLLPHIEELAKRLGSHLFLVHVADGWVAQRFEDFLLRESEEMVQDRTYLEKTAEDLRSKGLSVSLHLALGSPPEEILKLAEERRCDLIALTSHGHRFFADLFLGSTIETIRHHTFIPLLIVRMKS